MENLLFFLRFEGELSRREKSYLYDGHTLLTDARINFGLESFMSAFLAFVRYGKRSKPRVSVANELRITVISEAASETLEERRASI